MRLLDPETHVGCKADWAMPPAALPDGQGRPTSRTSPGDVSVFFDEDVTLVILSGDIDLALSGDLEYAGRDAIDRQLPVHLDLTRVTFMDSIGIGFVARLAASAREAGHRVRVVDASHRAIEALTMSCLIPLLEVAE
jgi:anti-anti-sigma factor